MTARSGERWAREVVYGRSDGRCELCGQRRGESWSHRLSRAGQGLWTPANGLHACGDGVAGCHGRVESERELAYLLGWRLRRGEDPEAHLVLMFGYAGRGWYALGDDGSTRLVTTSAPTHPW